MLIKIIAGIVGVALLLVYVSPVVLRLRETPLFVVAILGIGMMLIDLWQSVRSKED
jgi:hypothetical protein